ncbi:MAG: hypothetical protein E7322_01255 [Clostridiales bacterium]|nr:hypothetical protein [Clostridiales bacterium]
MTVTGEKGKWFEKINAGTWALMGIFALLCLLLISGRKETDDMGTDIEKRMERVIEKMEGVKDCDVMIIDEGNEITGVLIVCEGAEDISVRIRVQNAAKTLLNIENCKISVVPMGGMSK